MMLELNLTTFRWLVKLYLLSLVLVVVYAAYLMMAWWDFHEAFDALVIEHVGQTSDAVMFVVGSVLLVGMVMHIVAIFGLLRYRKWARSLIWISLLVMVPSTFVTSLRFGVSDSAGIWLELANGALLGMILMLAYSKDHGDVWFSNSEQNVGVS